MTTGKALNGKPYAGNPHVRFDEGAGASRHSGRSALLYTTGKALNGKPYAGNPYGLTKIICAALAAICVSAAVPSWAADLTITADTSLTEDTTVDALVVSPGVTLDLNGHSLTVSDIRVGAGGTIAGRYQLYEYVLATGSQYVMTDYTPAATDCAQAKVRYTNNNGTYQFLFCTRNSDGKQTFTCLRYNNNTSMRLDHGATASTATSAISQNTDYVMTIDGKAGSYSIKTVGGGEMTGAVTDTSNFIQSPGPFSLLSGGNYNADGSFTENSNYRSKCRLYWFRVFDANGMVKCCMVPAEDTTTSTVGLYDLVSGKFYAPAAGTLTASGTTPGIGGRVVNTSATEAALNVNVAQGTTVENDSVEIAGNVKFVKKGDGTYVAGLSGQNYYGGTFVEGGVLKCAVAGRRHPFGHDDENLVLNGDFEESVATGDYQFATDDAWANCRNWTCYGNGGTDGITGLTKSTVDTWVPKNMDIGTYAMVMRTHANGNDAYAEQTINIASPGKYRLRFTYMSCNGKQDRRGATFHARLIQGSATNTLCTLSTTDVNKRFYSGTVNVSKAGIYTLQIHQSASTKTLSTIFDDVWFSKVREDHNLLVNGSFDQGSVTANSGKYAYANSSGFSNPGWDCDGENIGLTTANNTWVQSGVDVGTYAAYLRTHGGSGGKTDAWLAQTVNVTTPGIYRLSFAYLACANPDRRGEPVEVRLIHNGVTNLVGTVNVGAVYGKLYYSTLVNMAETGSWTLQFWQKGTHLTGSSVRSTNIDDVSLELAPGVIVQTGGTIDMNGQTEYQSVPFTMAGGILANSGTRAARNGPPAIKRMLLTADSSFSLAHSYGFHAYENGAYQETFLDLGGHTLDMELTGDHMYVANCTMTNGILRVSADSDPSYYLTFIEGNSRAFDVDLEISNKLMPYSSVSAFRDLTLSADVTSDASIGGVIEVRRRFKSLSANYCSVRLLDGATIDLSENTSPLSMTSPLSKYGIALVEGGEYTIDTGNRSIQAGDKLLSWSERPALDLPWTFTLVCDGETPEERGLALSVRNDGLYVKDATTPAYARLSTEGEEPEWKFYTTNGTEVVGWSGGVTADMQVRFFSNAEFAAINALATPVTPSEFLLAGTFVLEEGEGVVDMTGGLAFGVLPGVTIDVKGRSLKLPNSVVGGTRAFTVTSSVAGGELIVDVASGTVNNTEMSLTGALKLVKQGAGTFTATKTGQTNTDGVDIEAGVLTCGAIGPDHPLGPANSVVTVCSNETTFGTLNMNGNGGFNDQQFVLAGGTLKNPGSEALKLMCLTADSLLNRESVDGSIGTASGSAGDIDLGGHTLTIKIASGKTLAIRNVEITDGKIDVATGGWLRIGPDGGDVVATNVEFRVNAALNIVNALSVRDYEAVWSANYNGGTNVLKVCGAFKPSAHNYFYGCTMLDGSTLDLTSRTNAWPVTSAFTGGSKTVTFAENANITVKLEGRTDLKTVATSETPYVATWTEQTAPPASVKFVIDPATRRKGYKVRRDDTVHALRLIKSGGLVIIVK